MPLLFLMKIISNKKVPSYENKIFVGIIIDFNQWYYVQLLCITDRYLVYMIQK